MANRYRQWIPAICVATLISLFSTHYFSSQQTARILYPLLRWCFPWSTPRMLYLMHVGIRKLAHVIEFGVFSITIFHGVRGGRSGWRFRWAIATLVVAASFAVFDEWHQSFVPLRQATARDVVIDGLGALLAQMLVWAFANRNRFSTGPRVVQSNAADD